MWTCWQRQEQDGPCAELEARGHEGGGRGALPASAYSTGYRAFNETYAHHDT